MENNSLISIVVPVYNVESYLKYCIDSILNQTYPNLEIVLVDDGSTDSSGKICDEYSQKDNRIKVIHKKNGGLADARNQGIKITSGKYLGFVDSDDYLHPEFFETLYKLIVENNVDIAECEFLRINIDDIKKAKNILNENNLKEKDVTNVSDGNQALKELYGARLKPYIKKVVVWNKLYKKELFNNIEFPIGRLHEDEFTTYKVFDKINKIVSINKKLYGYMQTKNSIMRKEISIKRIEDNLLAYEEATKYFYQNNKKEILHKVQRRYLENCIELAGKVYNEESVDKHQKLSKINGYFKSHYDDYFKDIEAWNIDSKEKEIIELIETAYNDKKDYISPTYWNKLEKIINKV